MEYEIIKNKIVYFKKAILNHKEIIECIENVDNNIITKWIPWGDKYSTSFEQKGNPMDLYGVGKSIYNPKFDFNNKSSEYYWVYESISNALDECSSIYALLMGIDKSINPRLETSGFVIGKYDNGKGKGLHIDCSYDDLEHSYVVYLNDNYKGGELYFPELEITFKPEAGSVVMFKSDDVDNIHEALPSQNENKYMIPHFWRMGPSQGFIPWGKTFEEFSDYISNDENLNHNYNDLERVNKKELYS